MSYTKEELTALAGTPVDLAPFTYIWRADRKVQEKPEADFIPRRIKRQDEVYRTLLPTLGKDADSICYARQHDTMVEQLPPAKGSLLTGAIWGGSITDYKIELVWPEGAVIPAEEDIEVRVYPTAWGWFGFSLDKKLIRTEEKGNVWGYPCLPDETMDIAYNARTKSATEVVAVFAPEGTAVPQLVITGDSMGLWKELTFTVEWGFDPALPAFEGEIETFLAKAVVTEMDKENKRAKITCLYSEEARYGIDSKLTCITDKAELLGATVLLRNLAKAPICVPEAGLFFCPEAVPMTAAEYIAAQKAEGKKSIREKVREHKEAADWEEMMRNIRLWRCPDGTEMPAFPEAPKASAVLHVPDKRWETMYELAVEQLRGHHMWGMLSAEVARSTLASEMMGLRDEADRIYDYFLESPGFKPDGDFETTAGCFEWGKSMRHDMGYAHEGTHHSTGKLIYSMMYRYYLYEDKEWLAARLPRIKQAADWLIREIRDYMKDTENRRDLHCYGLVPPSMLGDYALPACDWRWQYCDNAFNQMGLTAFADVLTLIGDPDADYYTKEAKTYEADLLAAVKREALYAPVREARDGMSRSFIPRMAYGGGLLHYGKETNIPQFAMGINDLFQAALPLGEIGGLLDSLDRRMVGTLDAMEEGGMNISVADLDRLDHPTATAEEKEARDKMEAASEQMKRTAKAPVPADDLWFWNTFSNLPKISHNANIYLRQDDIPNFLHFFLNHAIVMVGTNGKLWEHAHPNIYVECKDPDNGTAAWFTENFRNMLLTEDAGTFWLMKGTPRAWLKQGKVIEALDVPTMYGQLTYTTTSDADNGRITSVIDVPARREIPVMKLRLRHPEAAKIKAVTINGKAYDCIDADGETITFVKPAGKLEVVAMY
ncbi:MAG: hypothetical protein IJA85_00060 [Clostridia bacterium]|nr:hypothetical protein [Clostridia bacterium]